MALPNALVIDDDEDICESVRMSLTHSGEWQVRWVHSLNDAVEFLKTGMPDVVLLDLHLRETPGMALLPHIRQTAKGAAIPVVFLTASPTKDLEAKLLALGANAVLAKPIQPLTFAGRLKKALAQD
jgi:CheY-like chemotaxis protein